MSQMQRRFSKKEDQPLSFFQHDVGGPCEKPIGSACRDAGHHWRQRQLGPVITLHLFVLQQLESESSERLLVYQLLNLLANHSRPFTA